MFDTILQLITTVCILFITNKSLATIYTVWFVMLGTTCVVRTIFGTWHMSQLMASPSMWWWEIHIEMSTCTAVKRKSTTETSKSVWCSTCSSLFHKFVQRSQLQLQNTLMLQMIIIVPGWHPMIEMPRHPAQVGTVATKITFAHDSTPLKWLLQSINMFPPTWKFAHDHNGGKRFCDAESVRMQRTAIMTHSQRPKGTKCGLVV